MPQAGLTALLAVALELAATITEPRLDTGERVPVPLLRWRMPP